MSIGEFQLTTNELAIYAKMNSPVNKNEFVIWLQNEMDQRDWSQSDLAREANLSRGAVGNVLRQERDPGKDFLIGIAHALKIPPEVVFRAAGLLPEAPESTQESEELLHLYHLLPEADRKEILRYVRFIVEGHQKKKK